MNIAEKLIKLRKDAHLTQEQLLEGISEKCKFDLAISTYRNYENQNHIRKPRTDYLAIIAQFYEIDVDYLLYDSIENVTKINIKIGKELGLSDKAIDNLKYIKANENLNKSIYENRDMYGAKKNLVSSELNDILADKHMYGFLLTVSQLRALLEYKKGFEDFSKGVKKYSTSPTKDFVEKWYKWIGNLVRINEYYR